VQWDTTQSEYAVVGSDRHKALEKMHDGEITVEEFFRLWHCDISDANTIMSNINDWLNKRGDAEVALAYDVEKRTVRRLEPSHKRDYSDALPSELCMTLDWTDWETVIDYKTGSQYNLLSAARAGQLRTAALAVATLTRAPIIYVAFVFVDDDGSILQDTTMFDVLDIDQHADALHDAYHNIQDSKPNPGIWCKNMWCPAMASCPVGRDMLRVNVPLSADTELATAASVANAYAQLPVAEAYLSGLKKRIAQYVSEHGPIDVGDGKRLQISTVTRRTVDLNNNQHAIGLIQNSVGDSALSVAVSSTIKAIEKSAKQSGTSDMVGQLLKDLNEAGAIKTSTYTKMMVK